MDDWDAVETEVNRAAAESKDPIHPDTIANAREFLALVRGRCAVPRVARGYWPTISFSWEILPRGLEVEVFSDHMEIYQFHDGWTDIKHIAHAPGEPFTPAFLAALPMLAPSERID